MKEVHASQVLKQNAHGQWSSGNIDKSVPSFVMQVLVKLFQISWAHATIFVAICVQ